MTTLEDLYYGNIIPVDTALSKEVHTVRCQVILTVIRMIC